VQSSVAMLFINVRTFMEAIH